MNRLADETFVTCMTIPNPAIGRIARKRSRVIWTSASEIIKTYEVDDIIALVRVNYALRLYSRSLIRAGPYAAWTGRARL